MTTDTAATIRTLRAIADTIRSVKEVPSGVLYAQLMGFLTLDGYNRLLEVLRSAGLITITSGHLIKWTGPSEP